MFKKAILTVGIFATCLMLWFAVHNYRQAGPIADENLRGVALSLAAAIENLAVHDPSLTGLRKFRTIDIAYFALVDKDGVNRFHSNPDLIGKRTGSPPARAELVGSTSDPRVTLGTGERAFLFTSPLVVRGETLVLRLTLHTYRADAVVRSAKVNVVILLGLLAAGWLLSIGLYRYSIREELHRLQLARRESLAKLGEMGAVMAHEIRNPLGGIKGFAQVIAKRPAEERNAVFAQNIVAEAVRLENLVGELLAYASTDAGTRAPFDFADLLRQTANLLTPEASAQGITISTVCPASLACLGNSHRFEQVLLNLGKNALQATSTGGSVEFSLAAVGNSAVITVKDTGDGIAADDVPKVFEPFFTTKTRGTGLGLALCRKIVEEHEGTIHLESVRDEGTTVTVTVPFR